MAPSKPSHAQCVGVGWGKTRKPQQDKHQTPHLHMRVWFTVASPEFQWAWVATPLRSCPLKLAGFFLG